jgi:AcrR family transcriptional regulator
MTEKTEKKPPLQARSRETVKAIREATTRILGREGLAKLSTNRIAEVAGVSIGSLYQFFRDSRMRLRPLDAETAVFTLIAAVRGIVVAALIAKYPPDRMATVRAEAVELCVRYLEPERV